MPIPAPSSNKLVPTEVAIPTLKSANSIFDELTINWSPSTYKSPFILIIPTLSPIVSGSIIIVDGPVIEFAVILIAVPVAPVEKLNLLQLNLLLCKMCQLKYL